MDDHMHDTEETLSLSGLHIHDDAIDSEEVSKANIQSYSSSSSSSDQDFLGFFSEEWSHDPSYNTSPENIIFCGKIVSSKQSLAGDRETKTKNHTNPLFRSTSDSFRFMRHQNASRPSTSRSKSLPSSSSSCRSKWQMLMFGFGSGRFPSKMDMGDMKSRQLRRQTTTTVSRLVDEESGGRGSGENGWWRLVDLLGCSSGYERDTIVVI